MKLDYLSAVMGPGTLSPEPETTIDLDMTNSPSIGLLLDVAMAQRLARGMFQGLHPARLPWLIDLDRPITQLIDVVRERKPAGLITRWVPGVTERLIKLGLPTAVFSAHLNVPNVVCVNVDNAAVGELAAQHFIERGIRNFAFVGNNLWFSRERAAAYKAAVERAGFSVSRAFELDSLQDHSFEYAPGHAPLVRWLQALPKPIGIVGAVDRIAWQIVETCRMAGYVVPDEVAVLGINNDELFCSLARPAVSSVRVPWNRVGEEMALAMERLLSVPRGAAAKRQHPPVLVRPDGVALRPSTDLVAIGDPVVARALRYMRRHALEPITIKDLLRELALPRRSLEYAFRQHLHRTPREELTRLRIERAKDLLMDTELPMALVAERCGFNYAERFGVAFKRATGSTPLSFRRRSRSPQ